jgi:hypothetical protein
VQKGLTLPSVQVDLDAVDKAFAPHVAVADISKPAGNGESNSTAVSFFFMRTTHWLGTSLERCWRYGRC